ncbi:thiazolylpeptide-type bacteriocin [Ancrocorticia populi]|uniref:Thiazolylpeptide-type bacteriocin n=1 Tax=Ancrocorticia populi TaxID=2175228 RepID=A0A2V1KDB1_9ACTO|nr:thiazolylpeptide-type bacteriocin [Ancrocorticia populi]
MNLQNLATELDTFTAETFEVKDYVDFADMAFGSTCSSSSSSSCSSTCSSCCSSTSSCATA